MDNTQDTQDTAEFRPRFYFNRIFREVFTTKARYIDIWGGRAGGRSHFGSDYFLNLITQPHYFRGCFLRNVATDIRDSIFQDFKDRIENSDFDEEDFEINETKMTITHKATGNTIISKGFRKSSGNRSAKLKSLAGLTHVLIEEADENTEDDVNKLDDSIRTDKIENIQIIFLHNAPSKNHWITKRFYNLELTGILDEQGKDIPYYRATSKNNPDVLCIFSNYLANLRNLNAKTIHKYQEYGRSDSEFYNEEHYYTDVMGFIPEGAKGRIYKNWMPITREFFNTLPYPSYYGLDFGFSGDPAALVELKTHNNLNFIRQVIYERNLTDTALVAKMKALGVPLNADIYADPSAPKSIQEMKDQGYKRTTAALAGPDSILFGIKQLTECKNYVTEDSTDIWMENQEYKWKLDKEDNQATDEPIDKFNHAKDAIRYGRTSHKHKGRRIKTIIAKTATEGTTDTGKTDLLEYA